MVSGLLLAAVIATFAGGRTFALATCESKAVGKDGKALAGAAKASVLKKCLAEACASEAICVDGSRFQALRKKVYDERQKGRLDLAIHNWRPPRSVVSFVFQVGKLRRPPASHGQ